MLWRIAVISLTAVPPAMIAASFILALADRYFNLNAMVHGFTLAFLLLLYFVSRVMLLVLIVMSLRELSSGAYHTADWTSYIPHI